MVFIDEDQLGALEKKMEKTGYLDGAEMAMTFNMLRSNDLIWSFVVNNYLLGRSPAAFDLLYWNNDSTRMPVKMHQYYYYTNPAVPQEVEDWIDSAEYHEGSWWPYWHQWLYRKSGPKVAARIPGDGDLAVIEDAPGSYVKMK